jgi:hypothetical protein
MDSIVFILCVDEGVAFTAFIGGDPAAPEDACARLGARIGLAYLAHYLF